VNDVERVSVIRRGKRILSGRVLLKSTVRIRRYFKPQPEDEKENLLRKKNFVIRERKEFKKNAFCKWWTDTESTWGGAVRKKEGIYLQKECPVRHSAHGWRLKGGALWKAYRH